DMKARPRSSAYLSSSVTWDRARSSASETGREAGAFIVVFLRTGFVSSLPDRAAGLPGTAANGALVTRPARLSDRSGRAPRSTRSPQWALAAARVARRAGRDRQCTNR